MESVTAVLRACYPVRAHPPGDLAVLPQDDTIEARLPDAFLVALQGAALAQKVAVSRVDIFGLTEPSQPDAERRARTGAMERLASPWKY